MKGDRLFRTIQAALFLAFVLHRAYYHRRYPAAEDDTIVQQDAGRPGRLANLLALPAFTSLVLLIVNPRRLAWARWPAPRWGRWTGVLLALGGFGLLEWSHRALGRNWSDRPRLTRDQTLVTRGPYRWIRHPIYSAFLLILGSPLLITANWLVGLLWLLMTLLDIRDRLAFEEAWLAERFGPAYAAYRRRTGRLLPRFW